MDQAACGRGSVGARACAMRAHARVQCACSVGSASVDTVQKQELSVIQLSMFKWSTPQYLRAA